MRSYFRFRESPRAAARWVADMKKRFPGFAYRNVKGATAEWNGFLQPREGRTTYQIKVRVPQAGRVQVLVTRPALDPRARHRYRDGSLCLYDPDDRTWTRDMPLSKLVALAAVWLYFYEKWLTTGQWFVDEAPHGTAADKADPHEFGDEELVSLPSSH